MQFFWIPFYTVVSPSSSVAIKRTLSESWSFRSLFLCLSCTGTSASSLKIKWPGSCLLARWRHTSLIRLKLLPDWIVCSTGVVSGHSSGYLKDPVFLLFVVSRWLLIGALSIDSELVISLTLPPVDVPEWPLVLFDVEHSVLRSSWSSLLLNSRNCFIILDSSRINSGSSKASGSICFFQRVQPKQKAI